MAKKNVVSKIRSRVQAGIKSDGMTKARQATAKQQIARMSPSLRGKATAAVNAAARKK